MISFSTQKFFHFLALAFVFLSGLSLTNQINAQTSEDLFRGTWLIDTPDQGALIMIVKSQGRASYFWGDNTDRSVYQGTWAGIDESATLTWADGSQHRIERDSLGFGITHIDASGTERYTSQAEQVPQEILGQWAKAPTQETEAASDRDKAKGFFGIWKVGATDGNEFQYIFVESDRSAANTNGDLRGSWAKQGGELHIAWDSGQYSILRENRRTFLYKQIEPGEIIEDYETKLVNAARTNEDNVPAQWLAKYKAERKVFTGGIAFSSRKNARTFYRGDWIVDHSNNRYERIELSRFGGLKTSLDRSLEGVWRMQGQDIFMRWDDGMRKILSPIGRGFLLHEYKPGRPLDGVPTRIRAAAPADAAKLAEHLKGRADVAEQMLSLAEAAGIDPTQQGQAGWGRTFSRWTWPFGEDEDTITTGALLEGEFEAAGSNDPWWWPFWSERSATEPETTDSESVEMELDTIKSEGEAAVVEITEMEEAPKAEVPVANEPDEAETDSTEAVEITGEVDEELKPKTHKSTRGWSWPF